MIGLQDGVAGPLSGEVGDEVPTFWEVLAVPEGSTKNPVGGLRAWAE